MAPDILGAQAHFSTTQKLYSSSSDLKNTICRISKYIPFQKETYSPYRMWEVRKVPQAKMAKFPLQVTYEQPR